ncbi:uncharacterized protein LOC131328750 [Rhododendron vialii]|uniref:uncharacterized protein LOC131328750 n=1 Tax=Rhododendron vialii TaxID=182163 RepID=UPI00265E3DBB|nr:uncharacterized protein LOC131328750 [Rhododendron vialii]
MVVGRRVRGIQNVVGRGRGLNGGRGRGVQNEGGRGRGVTRGRGRGFSTASRGRTIGPNSGENTGANNGLVVKRRGPNQGILIGRERAANSQMVLGRGRGVNNGNGSRGGGRGRSGTTGALPGVVITERNPNITVDLGTNKGAKSGKGKEPIVRKVKIPMTRFGGAESIAPRVGLPIPQAASSSAASCGSGSGSGSATMPNTHIPRLDSQGATSTPSTQRSTT